MIKVKGIKKFNIDIYKNLCIKYLSKSIHKNDTWNIYANITK